MHDWRMDTDPTGPLFPPGTRSDGGAKQNITVPAGEVRVVDKTTGGEKGQKLARFDLIPTRALWLLAEVYGRGARKYADRNWEKGYAWGLSIAALERHFNAWKGGESIDEDTGAHHLAQVAWHAFTLLTFSLFGLGTDDRSKHSALKTLQETSGGPAYGAAQGWKHPEWTPPLPLGQGQNPKTREHISSERGVSAAQLKRDGAEEGTYRITVERERY